MSWSEGLVRDCSGTLAVVTGANSGIGFETARVLAAHGARVVLACRNAERGERAVERLRVHVPDADARFAALDLGSLAQIEAFAKELAASEPRVDLLVNNAGVMMPPLGRTADGFELQLGTNHLGHFALTGRLLGLLRAAPAARVVNVSSLAHWWGRIDFADPNWERGYNATLAYGRSKVANLLFTRELARRLAAAGSPAIAAAAHPGSTRTELQRHSGAMQAMVRVLSQEPALGALPSLYAATEPGVRGGDYFGPQRLAGCVGPPGPARSSAYSRDASVARRLWDLSLRLTGVEYAL